MVLQLLVMVAPHTVAYEQTSLPHFFKSGFRGWLSGDNLQQTLLPPPTNRRFEQNSQIPTSGGGLKSFSLRVFGVRPLER